MELVLKIYDKSGKNVEREVTGSIFDIMFGTVQEIMSLLEITEDMDSFVLLRKISSAYGELTMILNEIFPDVTADEWKRVKVKELIPLLIDIFKVAFTEILSIPVDPKNVKRV